MTYIDELVEEYKNLINDFIDSKDEDKLVSTAHEFSEKAIDLDVSPDEMVALHIELISAIPLTNYEDVKASLDVLQR